MREIVTLICSTLLIAASFSSNAQEDMVKYTLNANEPIIGCKIVAIKNSGDLGKIESIDGSYLNLRIHRDNVYRITINEEKTYYLQYETHIGFVEVNGIKISNPKATESWAINSDDALESDPGIKYRVQIGAFANNFSVNPFKNLGQLYTEEIDGGITRYMIGSFTSHDEAAEVEATIRGLGYTNAFAVVCYDGKRISFNEVEEWSVQSSK